MPYSSNDVESLINAGRMRKWYAAHGGESCPHGFGLKGYCARCQREGLEEEKSEEARDKRIAELESRLAALEQLIEEGGPGAGYTNA